MTLSPGDKVTIQGVGISKRGKLVIDGHLAGTRRKAKAVCLAEYVVGQDGRIASEPTRNSKPTRRIRP